MPATTILQSASDERPAAPIRPADMACSVACAIFFGLTMTLVSGSGSVPNARPILDCAGLSFLAISFFYRGSARRWWTVIMPLSLLSLMAPVAVWEHSGKLTSTVDFLRAILIPGLSFLSGNLFATFRDTIQTAQEGLIEIGDLKSRVRAGSQELRKMEAEMTDIIEWISNKPREGANEFQNSGWEPIDLAIDWNAIHNDDDSSTIGHQELTQILRSEMDRLSATLTDRPKIHLGFASPREFKVPVSIKGQPAALILIVRNLLLQAQRAIADTEGVIRLSMRPGLRSISISIEDNGRGLNELLVHKLESTGVVKHSPGELSLYEIRRNVEACGWRMEMLARLGVGARVTIEIPRSDAFAYGMRPRPVRYMEPAPSMIS